VVTGTTVTVAVYLDQAICTAIYIKIISFVQCHPGRQKIRHLPFSATWAYACCACRQGTEAYTLLLCELCGGSDQIVDALV
jgi:hypothetical protein